MPTPAEMVAALYDRLGRWQAVADACSDGGGVAHSAGYYQQVASGRIKNPAKATLERIVWATESPLTLLKRDFSRTPRYGFTARRKLGLRVTEWRNAHGLTFNEWMKAAQELMENHYDNI